MSKISFLCGKIAPGWDKVSIETALESSLTEVNENLENLFTYLLGSKATNFVISFANFIFYNSIYTSKVIEIS
jgi:hypothetical protein